MIKTFDELTEKLFPLGGTYFQKCNLTIFLHYVYNTENNFLLVLFCHKTINMEELGDQCNVVFARLILEKGSVTDQHWFQCGPDPSF